MRTLFVVLALGLAGGSAHAQVAESRGSLSVIGGIGKTLDDEGSLGGGWVLGGAIDHQVWGRRRVEASIEVITHDRNTGFFQSHGQTVIVGVSLVHRFGSRDAQPYLFYGLTAGHHSGTDIFDGSSSSRSSTNPGLRFGFGVAIRTGRRFEISPEIRLNGFWIDNDSDPATLPSFGVRFGWRM